jgi:small-conductance mechanosensitive channel
VDGYEGSYVVKEISLLSTIFKKTDGQIVQMPHTILNMKSITNYRRAGATSETITWDVDFGTTFEKIEELRNLMVEFVEHERRDFLPTCDISVVSFADQSKLTLSACIPYKSNWSNAALKSQVCKGVLSRSIG